MKGWVNGVRLWALVAAISVAALVLAGCGGGINYSFDPRADFTTVKGYDWRRQPAMSVQYSLVDKNVRYFADNYLATRGLVRTAENPDVVMAASYELEVGSEQHGYQLRTLNIYAFSKGGDLLWKGTAFGSIDGGAPSPDLRAAVEGILASFPGGEKEKK